MHTHTCVSCGAKIVCITDGVEDWIGCSGEDGDGRCYSCVLHAYDAIMNRNVRPGDWRGLLGCVGPRPCCFCRSEPDPLGRAFRCCQCARVWRSVEPTWV